MRKIRQAVSLHGVYLGHIEKSPQSVVDGESEDRH